VKGQKLVDPSNLDVFNLADLEAFAKSRIRQMADEARRDPELKKANESKARQRARMQQAC
jgi:hypothetical protein